MTLRLRLAAGTALATLMISTPAQAQDNAALQHQIDELKAQVQALTAALAANKSAPPVAAAPAPAVDAASPPAAPVALAAAPAAPAAVPVSADAPKSKAWYEKLSLRGYTQMRYNGFLSGDDTAPAGESRLRSPHDSSISDRGGFSLRRARLVPMPTSSSTSRRIGVCASVSRRCRSAGKICSPRPIG
jgi:hypothetical protein